MSTLVLTEAVADYGHQRVLGPLSLTLQRGERVALVGKSGAGKSSLLSVMHQHWRSRGAALMPQELGLVPSLSVFHNVYMGALATHPTWYNLVTLAKPFRRDVAAIRPLLARLSIDDKCWAMAGELSGGQRQRVAAARAIHQGGEVLLAMHDVELALRFTDRVIGIADGGIALDAPSVRLTAQDLLPLY